MTPAELAALGARVKPLVWRPFKSGWLADTAMGEVNIFLHHQDSALYGVTFAGELCGDDLWPDTHKSDIEAHHVAAVLAMLDVVE